MRPNFISDNLAAVSKPIRLFRNMIRSMDIDFEGDLRKGRLRDRYPVAFAFYDNIFHGYDDYELAFITRRSYHMAGIKDSMSLLGKYFGITFEFIKQGHPEDTGSFGKTYWEVHCMVSCSRQTFKNQSAAISQINDLINDLVYHAGDSVHKKNEVEFKVFIMEDELQNYVRDRLIMTQTPLVDKYFDRGNFYIKSLYPDSRFSVEVLKSGIRVSYIGDSEKYFRPFLVSRNIVLDSPFQVTDCESVISKNASAMIPYPSGVYGQTLCPGGGIRSGVRYWIYCREFVSGNWGPYIGAYAVGDLLGTPAKNFTRADYAKLFNPSYCDINAFNQSMSNFLSLRKDRYFDLNDVEIVQDVDMSGSVNRKEKGYTVKITSPMNDGSYHIFYTASSGSAGWTRYDRASAIKYGITLEIPYSSLSVTSVTNYRFQLRTSPDKEIPEEDARRNGWVYYQSEPPYFNAK